MHKTKRLATPSVALLLATLLLLPGCANQYEKEAAQAKAAVAAKIDALGKQLDAGQSVNALLIKRYAERLAAAQPDLRPIADLTAKEATSQGNLYKGLKTRLDAVSTKPKNKADYLAAAQELQALEAAADPILFNDALLDVVNTLADLSNGELARINIPPDRDIATIKGGKAPGSYLIGNPAYGNWQTNASGSSFWAFYGQYRLFSDLFMGPSYYRGPIGYNSWRAQPRYSYHNDYGRNLYGARGERQRAASLDARMRRAGGQPARPRLKYGSAQGHKRASAYAARPSGGGRKYGASGGPRHANRASGRQSSLFAGTQSGGNAARSRRASSAFSRSGGSARRGFGSRGFGGK